MAVAVVRKACGAGLLYHEGFPDQGRKETFCDLTSVQNNDKWTDLSKKSYIREIVFAFIYNYY